MSIKNIIKCSILAIAIAATFATTASFATELFNVQPSSVYQVIKGKPLTEALAQVAQRSGIIFKINANISNNTVNQTLAADSWEAALKELLTGYNYSTIQEGKVIKTVIISGYNGSAATLIPAETVAIPARDLIIITPVLKKLPAKYQHFPAGAVMTVELSIPQIMAMTEDSSADFNLPIGQFNISHDSTATDDTGGQTWVGHLSEEGQGYRMIISQGAAGVMGHITTPEGTFNIEQQDGSTYLIDTRLLQSAGYEGDTVTPNTALINWLAERAAMSISNLQTTVINAKNVWDEAVVTAKFYTDMAAKYNSALTAANNDLNLATTARDAAVNAYNTALKSYNLIRASGDRHRRVNTYNTAPNTYNTNQSFSNNAALENAATVMNTKKLAYATALNAYQTALNNKSALDKAIQEKVNAAANAKVNYDLAVQALVDATNEVTAKGALNALPTPSPLASTTDSIVDLMVLYTTASTTADYAKQRIAYFVTASNQAYIDSGVNMKLRLVYAEPTTYAENTGNTQALYDLAADRGEFAGVSQKRTQYGADLVFLFRPLHAKTSGSCGTTFIEFANGSPANKSTGYGTISDGNDKDLSSTFCDINTFTHEIGHSLGLVHEREYSSAQGAYNYSYAWGIQNKFGTIMSYKTPIVMLFSTPKLATQCAGTPCGFDETNATQSSDQVKSVNLTIPQVANFMPTMVTSATLK